ncbi:TraR/DksA C4-type zinc finger protein [Clostridium omnivorum]|uniref:Molecular chaperone DnaK n=1 Tax=Clostridium omnivorum TaxID=1604902 RepID=A0ABQ5NB38_9CLOT|nr:TraR/DksA C4-type zinc finger protein [Clostridium sp. E14]GLC32404.1 molecular chaperone DnaK [Clostridium sp. E14]
MNSKEIQFFKDRLMKEKRNVTALLNQMEENEAFNSKVELSTELSELSIYDNHPSDIATETFDQERGMALKEHELSIIKKIDDALANIDKGVYGKCARCGNEISKERLDFIPYTEFCIDCQKAVIIKPREKDNRPVEEEVIQRPFGYGFNDYDEIDDEVGFDAEDSYQAVQSFDYRSNVDYEFLDDDPDYVDPMEQISNQQYKNQLPD